jgi:uncharacterized RDD family membrane protein YckC
MSELSPGWYKDPADTTTQRYWDGEGWLGAAIPADATPPDGPPPVEEPPPAPPAVPRATAPPAGPQAGGQPAAGPPVPGPPAPGAPVPGAPVPGPPPPGWTPPPGWVPPPGWAPPPGWVPPPGWSPQPGMPMTYHYTPQIRPHGMTLAGMGPRLVARLFDIFVVLLLNVVVNGWFAYQWVLEIAPIFRATMADPLATPPQPSSRSDYLVLTMLFIATLLWLAYEVPSIGSSGQTLGKRIMHIKVVRVESTEPIGFGRAFRRWGRLGLWTPLWSCWGVGLLLQLIDSVSPLFDQKLRQALHDKTAGTVVVEAPPRPRQMAEPVSDGGTDDISGGNR